MEKIYLSDSGPKVSSAIYGFWRWSNEGESSLKAIEKTTNLCLELGINTFDHADVYGNSQVEELFGKMIEGKSFKREDIILFSKCGIRTSQGKSFEYYDNSKEYIQKSAESSLKKLKTDYLDIFLLHQADVLMQPEETAQALTDLVNQGKIKHIGITNFSVFQHQLLASYLNKPIVTNHIELNLLNTSAIDDGRIDFIKQRFSKPLAWSPLAGGRILTGTDEKAVKVRTKLEEIGKKYNANVEQTAVAWLAKLGTLPIIGSTSEQRIRNAASAFQVTIEREDWYELLAVAK
jgi:predicted oxidoreductase